LLLIKIKKKWKDLLNIANFKHWFLLVISWL
jgi:hypothetical protein